MGLVVSVNPSRINRLDLFDRRLALVRAMHEGRSEEGIELEQEGCHLWLHAAGAREAKELKG